MSAAAAGADGHPEIHHIEKGVLEQLNIPQVSARQTRTSTRTIHQLMRRLGTVSASGSGSASANSMLLLLLTGTSAILRHPEHIVIFALSPHPPISLTHGCPIILLRHRHTVHDPRLWHVIPGRRAQQHITQWPFRPDEGVIVDNGVYRVGWWYRTLCSFAGHARFLLGNIKAFT